MGKKDNARAAPRIDQYIIPTFALRAARMLFQRTPFSAATCDAHLPLLARSIDNVVL